LLKTIISDPHERQRLAEELGIKSITLSRWANSESDPRPQNLRHLLSAIPQQREQMLELIREETGFEEFTNAGYDDSSIDIPSAFYNRVFTARASTVESMRFWSLSNLILQQAISQLDPDRLGIALNVVRCMTPSPIDHKVHSLRESVGLGKHPWIRVLEQMAMFHVAKTLRCHVSS